MSSYNGNKISLEVVEMTWESAFKYLIAPGVVAAIVVIFQYFMLPRIEREKAREIALFKHKSEIFIRAIDLVDTHINAQKSLKDLGMMFEGHVPLEDAPVEEVNKVFSQLILSASHDKIPSMFQDFFGDTIGHDILVKRGSFILLLRKELYQKGSDLTADKVAFYVNKKQPS